MVSSWIASNSAQNHVEPCELNNLFKKLYVYKSKANQRLFYSGWIDLTDSYEELINIYLVAKFGSAIVKLIGPYFRNLRELSLEASISTWGPILTCSALFLMFKRPERENSALVHRIIIMKNTGVTS